MARIGVGNSNGQLTLRWVVQMANQEFTQVLNPRDKLARLARIGGIVPEHGAVLFQDGPTPSGVIDYRIELAGGKRVDGGIKKAKKTELSELAREATKSFVDAQKKLFDVAGRQMSTNVKSAGKTLDFLKFPSLPLAELTREGVKSYVDAQKALMDVMLKPRNGQKHAVRGKKPARAAKKEVMAAGAA